eukprot:gene11411-11207_t
MLGYAYGEIEARNRSFVERIHPEDRERVERAFTRHLENLSPTYTTELRLRCKDGSWKWILTSGMVVRRDAQGKPLRMIGTHVDIQERKEAEALLQQSEERWKLAMESTGDGIWDWHIQESREYFSKRLVEMKLPYFFLLLQQPKPMGEALVAMLKANGAKPVAGGY